MTLPTLSTSLTTILSILKNGLVFWNNRGILEILQREETRIEGGCMESSIQKNVREMRFLDWKRLRITRQQGMFVGYMGE